MGIYRRIERGTGNRLRCERVKLATEKSGGKEIGPKVDL